MADAAKRERHPLQQRHGNPLRVDRSAAFRLGAAAGCGRTRRALAQGPDTVFAGPGSAACLCCRARGGMVGEWSAFLEGGYSMTAMASSDVLVRQIGRQQLRDAMERDPGCLRQVLWLANIKLRIIANQNLLLSQATAAQRVLHHLLQLADTYGQAVDGGTLIGVAFTHQEMANITGLSRVMVSNVLIALHEQGLIGKSKLHCVIRDMQALRRRAAGS